MPDDASRTTDAAIGEDAELGSQNEVVVSGLDGSIPLGFIAGVGLQRVLADRAADGEQAPRLSWRHLDAWRPVLHGPSSIEEVIEAVCEDAQRWEGAPILGFRYLKLEKKGPKPFAGLNAPVAVLRQWLKQRRNAEDDTSLRYVCSLMCETATSSIKEAASVEQLAEHGIGAEPDSPLDRVTQPTFFDFTSRNAQFLDQAETIRAYLDREIVTDGLQRGRPDPQAPRSMDWDPGADTPGAIYTGYERGFLPVAEWLAFRGLVCFPVAGRGSRLATTACTGRRKSGEIIWPLWDCPAGPETVRSLIAYPRVDRLDRGAREALGIAAVWRAELTKKADGYSGMFSPPQPA